MREADWPTPPSASGSRDGGLAALEAPLTVIYIGGGTKSGSTLLDLMVGQVPGLVSVGELRQLWERGLAEDARCGCRRRFSECPFWRRVGREAFGGWDRVDLDEVLRLRSSLDRLVATRSAFSGDQAHGARLLRYVALLGALLEGIRRTAGAGAVVDSSKTPAHALLLARVPGVDLRLVHLVRDSRGVVHSWKRSNRGRERRRRLETLRGRAGIDVAASIRWSSYNRRVPKLEATGVPYLRLRYEDMVADARGAVERVLRHAGVAVPEGALGFLDGGRVWLRENHTVYGNRLRFSVGELELREDDEWRRHMRPASLVSVTAMTFPLLRRYGYPLRPSRSPGGRGRHGEPGR